MSIEEVECNGGIVWLVREMVGKYGREFILGRWESMGRVERVMLERLLHVGVIS